MKCGGEVLACYGICRRSREGAWIEMVTTMFPATLLSRRSREGAWIEIGVLASLRQTVCSRSRKGAWIEIGVLASLRQTVCSRSRKGAWIEIGRGYQAGTARCVAPVRERGLKCYCIHNISLRFRSLP